MTYYQETILEEAKDMWERGLRIPQRLFVQLAVEGMDVLALETLYFKES